LFKKTEVKSPVLFAVGVVALLGAIGAGFWYMTKHPAPTPIVLRPTAPAPAASAVAVAPEAAPSAPVIAYPIETPVASDSAPLDINSAITDLVGRQAVLSLFQLADFPRRVAATVDNLGRGHAPASLWPVNPASGKVIVTTANGSTTLSPDNGLRYTPYLLLVESVDMRQAAATYVRLYPLIQRAYEEIGFPGRYFNDRLVEVIDQLLATPEPNAPLGVHLPTINGPVRPQRPWVLYEFDDPALQSLTAGQRIMLRMGPVNERRMKMRIADFRRFIARPAGTASAR